MEWDNEHEHDRAEGKEEAIPLRARDSESSGKEGRERAPFQCCWLMNSPQRGYEVCLLDADSTNVGMHKAFGFRDAPTPLIEYFGGMVFSGGLVTCPVDDPTPLPRANVFLSQLPSSFFLRTSDHIHLLSGGKLGDLGPGAGCDGPISKIARDLEIRGRADRTLTIVDLKAGIEDSARGVLTKLDWAIVVVDPTTAAVQMAESLREMVRQIRDGVPPATEHLDDPAHVEMATRMFRDAKVKGVLAILNRVPDFEMEFDLSGKVCREALVKVIGALREDPSVGKAWLDGLPVYSPENKARVSGIVDWMEAAEGDASEPEAEAMPGRMPSGSAA